MTYFLRHLPSANPTDIIQGTDGIGLSDVGRIQAVNIATKLKRFNLEYIVSSNITRAQQTAEIIGDALRIPVKYDSHLNEYNYGNLTGHSAKGLCPTTLECFLRDPVNCFEAESFESAFSRVGNFLESIDYRQNILVVTHSTILYIMMCYLEKATEFDAVSCWKKRQEYPIKNGDVLRISGAEPYMKILRNAYFCKMKPQHRL